MANAEGGTDMMGPGGLDDDEGDLDREDDDLRNDAVSTVDLHVRLKVFRPLSSSSKG